MGKYRGIRSIRVAQGDIWSEKLSYYAGVLAEFPTPPNRELKVDEQGTKNNEQGTYRREQGKTPLPIQPVNIFETYRCNETRSIRMAGIAC